MSDCGRLSEDKGRAGGAPVIARKLREKVRCACRGADLRNFVGPRRRTDTALPPAMLPRGDT
jgi:hypothetical protein